MLTIISFISIMAGFVFGWFALVGAPIALDYQKKGVGEKAYTIVSIGLTLCALLNVITILILLIFSFKIATIVTSLILIINLVVEFFNQKWRVKGMVLTDQKLTFVTWAIYGLIILVTIVLRTLPGFTYLFL